MEMISISICLMDQEYAERFGERLACIGRELDVEIIPGVSAVETTPGELAVELTSGILAVETTDESSIYDPDSINNSDYILADEHTWRMLPNINKGQILVLTEAVVSRPEGIPDNVRFIDGFRGVSELLSFIRRDYSLRTDCRRLWGNEGEQRTEFICCLGLAGRSGTSSLAIGIGRELAAYREKRTIYISLETVEADGFCMDSNTSFNEYPRLEDLPMPDRQNIGDFLYLVLKNRVKNMELFLESQLHRDNYGLHRFRPSRGINDLRQLSETELASFIKIICDSGYFDYIVFDLGSEPGEHFGLLAETCTGLVLVGNGSEAGGYKEEKMLAVLREKWHIKDRNKVLVKNMISDYGDVWHREVTYDEMDGSAVKGNKGRLKMNFSFPRVLGGNTKVADLETIESSTLEEDKLKPIEIGFDRDSFRIREKHADFVLSNEFGNGVKKIVDRILLAEGQPV
ncbi:hypothetical protein FACS1894127_6890 [Clostridia bacterium]|nr:hypothetical protein FACS1894127_6890 [Clostridia bacterium]